MQTFCSNLILRGHFNSKIINYALMVRYAARILNLNFSPTLRELRRYLVRSCKKNVPILIHLTQWHTVSPNYSFSYSVQYIKICARKFRKKDTHRSPLCVASSSRDLMVTCHYASVATVASVTEHKSDCSVL